jgi:hypothetical protein
MELIRDFADEIYDYYEFDSRQVSKSMKTCFAVSRYHGELGIIVDSKYLDITIERIELMNRRHDVGDVRNSDIVVKATIAM